MRKAIGRIALLLGVAVVAAMAWYGAMALFDEDDSDDQSSPDVECVAVANKAEARAAQRRLVRLYGKERWFSAVRVTSTEEVDGAVGSGWVLLVDAKPRAAVPELPTCLGDVPITQE